MEEQLASLAAWVQTAVVSGSSSRESSIRTTPSEDSKPPSVVGSKYNWMEDAIGNLEWWSKLFKIV